MNECCECNELKTEDELATTPPSPDEDPKCVPHFCWDCFTLNCHSEVIE